MCSSEIIANSYLNKELAKECVMLGNRLSTIITSITLGMVQPRKATDKQDPSSNAHKYRDTFHTQGCSSD